MDRAYSPQSRDRVISIALIHEELHEGERTEKRKRNLVQHEVQSEK